MFHSGRSSPRAGFTLVEILGVVVILGIASAVILPQLGSRDDQKATAAARVIMADLMYAQNRAITKQKTHYVQFTPATHNYRILESMSPATVISNPVDGTTYQVFFSTAATNGLKDVQLFSASFDTQPIIAFDALGVPHSYNASTATMTAMTGGSIVVKSGAYQMTISIAPFSGELTVQ